MYYCTECGYQSVKWLGKCPSCQSWEVFSQRQETKKKKASAIEVAPPQLLKDLEQKSTVRHSTGFGEVDRLLGGGMVDGEIILVGGAPGVGKSTLLLEICAKLAQSAKTLYLSAEESPQQIGIRSKRLTGQGFDSIYLWSEDDLEELGGLIEKEGFKFLVIDSIQVVYCSSLEGAKGSVTQIRGSAEFLRQLAKRLGIIVFVVGHVTKEGVLAGPKLLEHVVDCVLYFEGEMISDYRILRANKNRFGAVGDLAIFEMRSDGLKECKQVSDIFLPHREMELAGSCVVCTLQGARPFLIELQALVSRANFGNPRRRSLGFDFNRFSLLVAVIEKRLKSNLSSEDIFLNVAGGLRIDDPATDLGVILAIISSFKDKALPSGTVSIAEVGLAGELRRVTNINQRLKELARCGFRRCLIPADNLKELDKNIKIECCAFERLDEVVAAVLG